MRGENRQKVLDFIRHSHPGAVSSADIMRRTGVSQPQVYQIARALMDSGLVRGARKGRSWRYTWNKPAAGTSPPAAGRGAEAFAQRAREHLGRLAGGEVKLRKAGPSAFLLSAEDCAGYALHFTAPEGGRMPVARLAFINGHLWLLEKSAAERLFLILGGDETTAEEWAREFAPLCLEVEVLYLGSGGVARALT